MKAKMCRSLALIGFLLGLVLPALAQDAASVLLPRINSLRAAKGLPAYAPHASLNAAAANHARWLAANDAFSHQQEDGTGPRARALQAGFPSSWVSENYYKGATLEGAWNFWRYESPLHYAGLVSPNYDKIGIASASGARGNAYVLVFGNSTGRLPETSAGTAGGAGGSISAGGQPSYVLGLDEFGNIKHEVQPGQTIGHILLIYGYTWDDYPYLLEMNGMSEADRLNMQPGSVILVPPQAGTFTPAPAPATVTVAPTAAAKATTAPPRATDATATPTATATASATLAIRIAPAATTAAIRQVARGEDQRKAIAAIAEVLLLGAAMVIQLGIFGGASIELISRSR